MKNNILLFCLFLITTPLYTHAQNFQLWTSATVKTTVANRFGVHLRQEIRLDDNGSHLKFHFSELGVEYKINQSFKAFSAYRLFFTSKYFNPIHRSSLGLKYNYKLQWDEVKAMRLSTRATYQRKYYIETNEPSINVFRLKFEMKYEQKNRKKQSNRFSSLLSPFVLAEGFYAFNTDDAYFKRYRLAIGTDFNLSDTQSLRLRYIFQQNFDSSTVFNHVLNVAYRFTLKY